MNFTGTALSSFRKPGDIHLIQTFSELLSGWIEIKKKPRGQKSAIQ